MSKITVLLYILSFLLILIVTVLLLPIGIIIKSGKNDELVILFSFLGKIYGENPDPNNQFVNTLKKVSGVSRLEKGQFKADTKKIGITDSVSEYCRIIIDLLKELYSLLGRCTATKFKIQIVCSEEDAAETAIAYGRCCAIVYPLVGIIGSIINIKKSGQSIELSCDYTGKNLSFRYEFIIRIGLFHILSALVKIIFKETKRTVNTEVKAGRRSSKTQNNKTKK